MQMNSLLELLGRLKRAYNIPESNFLGHADVAPGRKIDPSRFFPWKLLADKGFGLWYDTAYTKVSPDFNAQLALRLIGYNIKDSIAAIQSYKIHFVPGDTTTVINEVDKKILTDLIKRYQ
jgi:N-acetylmuramoyl-L-alanine amidase